MRTRQPKLTLFDVHRCRFSRQSPLSRASQLSHFGRWRGLEGRGVLACLKARAQNARLTGPICKTFAQTVDGAQTNGMQSGCTQCSRPTRRSVVRQPVEGFTPMHLRCVVDSSGSSDGLVLRSRMDDSCDPPWRLGGPEHRLYAFFSTRRSPPPLKF